MFFVSLKKILFLPCFSSYVFFQIFLYQIFFSSNHYWGVREVLERGLRFQQYLHYFLLILAGFYGNLFFFTILLKLQYKFNFYNFFVTLVSILFFISSIFFIQLIFQILLKFFLIKFFSSQLFSQK